MGDISYTDERAEKMLYSDMPMGEEKYILYADLEASGIRPSELSTINGRHVGTLLGSKTEMMLTAWERSMALRRRIRILPILMK